MIALWGVHRANHRYVWLAAAHWRLGVLHEHRKRPAQARAEYETRLRLDPDPQEAREALRRVPR